jgi:hypothetical protein
MAVGGDTSSFIKPHAVRHHQRSWAKNSFMIFFFTITILQVDMIMKTLAWVGEARIIAAD